MFPFYDAIKRVLLYGKCMKRMAWPENYCILCNESDTKSYVLLNTGTSFELYTPSSDDLVAEDWYERR